MELNLSEISKSYGSNKVLDDLSLTLHSGEIVGLIGRNGVGKTTLLKIIAGISSIDNGTLTASLPKASIGFLSEKNPLYPDMYIPEYLKWVSKLNSGKDALDINQVIQSVGLENVLPQKIGQLSKGYKQRVGLAAAMIGDPDILILDEPINGLDPVQIEEYRKVVRALGKDRIVILSSHLMQEVEAICDRVILIKEGCIERDFYVGNDTNEWLISIKLDEHIKVEKFNEIKTVSNVTSKGNAEYIISASTDIRLQLFDCVVDNQCKLKEMVLLDKQLEQLF